MIDLVKKKRNNKKSGISDNFTTDYKKKYNVQKFSKDVLNKWSDNLSKDFDEFKDSYVKSNDLTDPVFDMWGGLDYAMKGKRCDKCIDYGKEFYEILKSKNSKTGDLVKWFCEFAIHCLEKHRDLLKELGKNYKVYLTPEYVKYIEKTKDGDKVKECIIGHVRVDKKVKKDRLSNVISIDTDQVVGDIDYLSED